MNKLHPGARWMFRLNFYRIFLGLIIFLIVFSIALLGKTFNAFNTVFTIIFSIIFAFVILLIIIGEIYARMAYNRWLYEFGADNLKIEKGIIWKKYSNIPYERVQNIDITRGILARMLGFSTVNIQTAGYSGPSPMQWKINGIPVGNTMNSEGYIPAVDMNEAEKIRTFLMKKITNKN